MANHGNAAANSSLPAEAPLDSPLTEVACAKEGNLPGGRFPARHYLLVLAGAFVEAGLAGVDVSSGLLQPMNNAATAAINKTFFIYVLILLLRNAAETKVRGQ